MIEAKGEPALKTRHRESVSLRSEEPSQLMSSQRDTMRETQNADVKSARHHDAASPWSLDGQ